ncbi:ATP-binding protein [Rickettsiella massiliensis]|uniref:ATP-binding protein n=1 Tax=Rickettsiella massiliensis TaxID=676517 RepID=UPI00029AFDD6|nr:ATP-binding protein [Rickettsiella massiliensis]
MKNKSNLLSLSFPIIYRLLISYLPVNVFIVDKEGYLIWVNSRMIDILKKTEDYFIGRHISHWGNDKWEACKKVLEKGQEQIVEERGIDQRVYLTNRTPVKELVDKNIIIQGVIGVSLDITKQKQAHIAKQEFIQNMAHDIRTPLAGVIGLAQLQKEGLESLEESKEYGQMIYETGNQLLDLLNAVIKVIDTEQMTDSVKVEPLDLSGLTKELYALMEPSAYTKGLKLVLDVEQNLPLILSDRIKLKRIFLNILSNAVKFTKIGEIRFTIKLLEIEKGCAKVEVKVADTGIGIAKENINKIFDRFYREHPSYLAEYSGYGLGLYLVKEILTLLGGEINVASKEGKGSCFTLSFTFPLAHQNLDKAETVLASSKKSQGKTGSVLIAEDNTIVLRVLKNQLEEAGYEVMVTMDGQAALEALKNPFFLLGTVRYWFT